MPDVAHHCHARGCKTKCKPEFLMCPPHWRFVPVHIQRAVYRHYRAGQCEDKSPTAAWHVAADAAIGAVAQREGQPLRATEVAALVTYGELRKDPAPSSSPVQPRLKGL